MRATIIIACTARLASAAFALHPFVPDSARAQDGMITGRASVIDGDTLEIAGRRIRLFGIDAPERGQSCTDGQGRPYRCGAAAANALDERIGGRPIACSVRDVDRYGRAVAVCLLGADDLNGWLARRGLAVAYRRYSGDYAAAEDAARADKAGLWAGTFEAPEAFRHRGR